MNTEHATKAYLLSVYHRASVRCNERQAETKNLGASSWNTPADTLDDTTGPALLVKAQANASLNYLPSTSAEDLRIICNKYPDTRERLPHINFGGQGNRTNSKGCEPWMPW
jgi:hypothetical protein